MNSPSSTTPRDKTLSVSRSPFPVSCSPFPVVGKPETGNTKTETEKRFSFLLVTPVLDGWPRIRAAVASVAAQDVPGLRIRHIVQLSARSSDPSGEWLRSQPGVECRVEADTGLYDAISRGFGTEGDDDEILAWLNSDEQMLPGTLARVAEEFRRHPETDVVFGDYLLLDADGRPTAWRREIPANPWLLRNGVNSILSCATFFRRRVWKALGGFDPTFSLVADKDFYLRALAAGFRFRHIRAPQGAYANTGDNATLRHPLLALREQARLREKAGASGPAMRRLARILRCLSKFVHGCYGRRRLETTLFDSEGSATFVCIRIGTRWEDPADEVARRRIFPSPFRRFAFAAIGLAAVVVRAVRHAVPFRSSAKTAPSATPIVLLEPFGLGDAIALQPLVRALCEAGREVRVGTSTAWYPVFPPHPNLHLFEAVPPWAVRDERSKYAGLFRRFRPFLRVLRPEARGAMGIDPRGDVRSILALHLAGCSSVETLECYYTANDCPVMPGAAHRHPVVRTVPRWQLNGVFALDLDLSPPDLRFLLEKTGSPRVQESKSPKDSSVASQVSGLRFQDQPETGNRKPETVRIALLPMTPWIGKRWTTEGWQAVIRGILERGAEPFALCGPGEESETAASMGNADVPVLVCDDVRAWAETMAGFDAAIAVNTGPMHIAAALGVPVVLLEGSSRQPLWQPPGERFEIVSRQRDVSCAPCHQVGDCRRCGRRCMTLLDAHSVLAALDRLRKSPISIS